MLASDQVLPFLFLPLSLLLLSGLRLAAGTRRLQCTGVCLFESPSSSPSSSLPPCLPSCTCGKQASTAVGLGGVAACGSSHQRKAQMRMAPKSAWDLIKRICSPAPPCPRPHPLLPPSFPSALVFVCKTPRQLRTTPCLRSWHRVPSMCTITGCIANGCKGCNGKKCRRLFGILNARGDSSRGWCRGMTGARRRRRTSLRLTSPLRLSSVEIFPTLVASRYRSLYVISTGLFMSSEA